MKVWTPLFNFIAIFVLILLIPAYYTFSKSLDKEFDQARLDIAVDKATKAMMYAATDVDDIQLDYINPDSIVLTPGSAKDMFDILMCFTYDIEPTNANKNIIENSICSMVLADEYGYYIAELVEDDLTPQIDAPPTNKFNGYDYSMYIGKVALSPDGKRTANDITGGDYSLRWSMRTPYSRTYTDATGTVTETLSFSYSTVFRSRLIGNTLTTELVKEEATNKSDVIKEINDCISSAIEAEISRRNDGNFEFKFYLPYETTELGVNPISGPSALVFLNNATYASRYSIDAVNVGGYRAQQRQYIVGFTKNGVKYYCYAKQLPDSAGLTVENYFETMLEAAKAGYAPYMPYLMNDKNTKAN